MKHCDSETCLQQIARLKEELAMAFRVVESHKKQQDEAVRIGCENIKSRDAAEARVKELQRDYENAMDSKLRQQADHADEINEMRATIREQAEQLSIARQAMEGKQPALDIYYHRLFSEQMALRKTAEAEVERLKARDGMILVKDGSRYKAENDALKQQLAAMRAALQQWLNAPWTSPTGRGVEPPCLPRDVWHHRMDLSRQALSPAPPSPCQYQAKPDYNLPPAKIGPDLEAAIKGPPPPAEAKPESDDDDSADPGACPGCGSLNDCQGECQEPEPGQEKPCETCGWGPMDHLGGVCLASVKEAKP